LTILGDGDLTIREILNTNPGTNQRTWEVFRNEVYLLLKNAVVQDGVVVPAAHASTHQNGGSDEINVDGLSGLLADSQTPLAHKTSHQAGGSDAIKLDDLSATDDNTDLNSSSTAHGLLPKLSNVNTQFLNGQGGWAVPPGIGFTTVNIQALSGSGTYTPTAGMKYGIAFGTGSGAGGGGSDATGDDNMGVGSGGGAGETSILYFSASTIGASQPYAVGTGGGGGSDAGGNGSDGNDTTLGTAGALLLANGGTGGLGNTGSAAISEGLGGAGGTGGTGTFLIPGGVGGTASAMEVQDGGKQMGRSGHGGGSFWGPGGIERSWAHSSITADIDKPGNAGVIYGSGGSGAITANNTSGNAGGDGANGTLMIIEFI